MVLSWQLVMVQFFFNSVSQYGAITMAGNICDTGPKGFLEPFIGLGVAYKFTSI